MIEKLLGESVSILGGTRSTVLEENAETALGAVGASNLLCVQVSKGRLCQEGQNQLTSAVEVTVTTTRGNQVSNLVMDRLQRSTRVGIAHEAATTVDTKRRNAGDKEEDGRELHFDV